MLPHPLSRTAHISYERYGVSADMLTELSEDTPQAYLKLVCFIFEHVCGQILSDQRDVPIPQTVSSECFVRCIVSVTAGAIHTLALNNASV